MPHPFLSDEWIDEIRAIRDEYRDHAPPVELPAFRANLVVTDVPFGAGKVRAFADSTSGTVEIELGHVPDPDVRVTLGYELARALIVEQRPDVVARAWIMGKIRVDGDLTKLLPAGDPMAAVDAATEAAADPVAAEIGHRIKAATA